MKVISILGTRPEIIRTSRILPKLDALCDHTIIHTAQNFTHNTKDLFFEELGLRQPDITFYTSMNDGNTHTEFGLGQQLADMFPQVEKAFKDIKPDRVFILGDTNSALCAIMAERMGIPVGHMESSNRSYNNKIPEEVNRRLLDHICSRNLFYTPTNRHTLLMEGHDPRKIFQCGNPTLEVLTYYKDKINQSRILWDLGLMPHEWPGVVDPPIPYFLVDIHRSENVSNIDKLDGILEGINLIAEHFGYPVICSVHPKTRDKLKTCRTVVHEKVKLLDAFGFFDFVKLEKHARVGLTDSGLCSEEYNLLRVPCVIVRNETERPEVVEAGGAIISGIDPNNIIRCTEIMDRLQHRTWETPQGYEYLDVSDRVVNYMLSEW